MSNVNELADLRTIVKGAPEKILIKDKYNKDHELCPLDLADLIEYEDVTGASLLSEKREFKMKDLAYLLYLSIRKEGLDQSQIEKHNYKYKEHAVFTMFDLNVLAKANEIITDLLRISGLIVPKEEEKVDSTRPTESPVVETEKRE